MKVILFLKIFIISTNKISFTKSSLYFQQNHKIWTTSYKGVVKFQIKKGNTKNCMDEHEVYVSACIVSVVLIIFFSWLSDRNYNT